MKEIDRILSAIAITLAVLRLPIADATGFMKTLFGMLFLAGMGCSFILLSSVITEKKKEKEEVIKWS